MNKPSQHTCLSGRKHILYVFENVDYFVLQSILPGSFGRLEFCFKHIPLSFCSSEIPILHFLICAQCTASSIAYRLLLFGKKPFLHPLWKELAFLNTTRMNVIDPFLTEVTCIYFFETQSLNFIPLLVMERNNMQFMIR